MTFQTDETGVESSAPRDGFEFILPTVTYRLTSAVKDVVIGGQTYRAGTITRGDVAVATDSSEGALEIAMPVSHAISQRYLRGGIPPSQIEVTVRRLQSQSAEHVMSWFGRVQSMAIDAHTAKFLVQSQISDAFRRRIPTITVGRDCPHILYGSGCNADPAGFTVTRTVTGFDGARVIVDTAPNATDDWAKWGELVHVASGEKRTISASSGTTVTMQLPIVELQTGDTVLVRAGCSHDVDTCFAKFANQPNYGGLPHRPSGNPFIPSGRGVFNLKQFGF